MARKNKTSRKAKKASRQGVGRRKAPKTQAISHEELREILSRVQGLSEEEQLKLSSAVDTLALLTAELEAKGASVRRLKALLFGPKSERTSDVLARAGVEGPSDEQGNSSEDCDKAKGPASESSDGAQGEEPGSQGDKATEEKKKRPGHGRNGADAYTGAKRLHLHHPELCHKDPCPTCQKGRVYRMKESITLVRVTGVAPLSATVYELERLRCNLCGEIFKTPAPEGVGGQKYDESARAMLALLKYGCGLPFYRLERLQDSLGLPMPSATQWDKLFEAYTSVIAPIFGELVFQAAQGDILHNDDTTMKVLDLDRDLAEQALNDSDIGDERTGCFTSGILSTREDQKVALFFTGRRHAGENLGRVLAERASELGLPIQMCDALSRNTTGVPDTLLGNCLAHARRGFVDVANSFPTEVAYVLTELSRVYHNDELTKERAMDPEQRLAFHQKHSAPVMDALHATLSVQFEQRLVEPNSSLGKAITYMLKHWEKLTLFLRVPGAPLDNNLCEQILKRAILHRKNAMFYRNLKGARVGDAFMSVIHTCTLNQVNPFDYLVAIQRYAERVREAPEDWLPWNYHLALKQSEAQA
jgi:hypothetical protein